MDGWWRSAWNGCCEIESWQIIIQNVINTHPFEARRRCVYKVREDCNILRLEIEMVKEWYLEQKQESYVDNNHICTTLGQPFTQFKESATLPVVILWSVQSNRLTSDLQSVPQAGRQVMKNTTYYHTSTKNFRFCNIRFLVALFYFNSPQSVG